MTLELDRERLVTTMREQAEIGSAGERALNRLALTDADWEVRDWFRAQLEDAGLAVRVDEMGNMFGRREGTDPNAGPVLLGSHLDSQPNGGIYDGALGVVAALEFVRTLNDDGIETRHPVEVVNWTNEEGSRFQPAMMSSGVWAGAHDLQDAYDTTDADGTRFEDELERIGYKGEIPAEPQEDYEAFLELHVEQGPYLEEESDSVGVVTGVVGFTWGEVTFHGQADHAGPTPMAYRVDPMVAAADLITAVRRIPGTLGERTVGTTGYVDVKPNSINVIPEVVTLTWDFRDPEGAVVEEAYRRVVAEVESAADREGVEFEYEERQRAPAVEFAPRCVKAVEAATDDLDYNAVRLPSGAGHDATHMTSVCDTGMVFAPSKEGKSHSPEEYTSWNDCYRAATTLANAALDLAAGDDER